ncbi:zinc-binding dehydrogenase [Asanoa sp. NPDC049573]|uniref:quinone oxidoreductase family protein n=1 Tax=Asanoa sp. NPDC049573 TaxID=3155396 RepID=UPI00343D30D5
MSISRYGGPEVFEQVELDEPVPGPGEVSITVSHASVGLIDTLIRKGMLAGNPAVPQPPFVPGIEVAGVVRAVGAGVDRVRVGEEVATLTLPGFGGYAEVTLAPADLVVPLGGTGVDRAQAVAGFANAATAYLSLTRAITMPASARVLVHGALGGLASVYPGVARLLGAARVVGTVRRESQIDGAMAYGFDVVSTVDRLSEGAFDVIVDPVGGDLRTRSLDLLAPMGRLLAVGSAGSETGAPIDSNRLWLANLGVVGFNVGGFLGLDSSPARAAAEAIVPLFVDGAIRLPVTTLPFDQAAEAHRRMDEHQVLGRLVLRR